MAQLAINGAPPLRTTPFPSDRDIGEEELRLVQEVIASKLLNRTQGHMTRDFELRFAEAYGVGHCTASMSGTSAIHVAVGALNPDPCDEFITAPITDMGTIIPILAQNCLPVFADIDPVTYNMSPQSIAERITDRTRGIILVHLFGNPCDMDPIMELARERNLYVIEDCSQAYGTRYKGKHVGTIGHMGTFSLQQSKHISTGDGGLTVTNDDLLGERATLFANKGWPNYGHSERNYVMFGMCYRMTELQAAVLDAQIGKVDWVTERRAELGDMICAAIKDLEGLQVPGVSEGGRHTYWFLPLLVDQEQLGISTSKLAQALGAEGAPAGAHYIGQPIFMYDLLRQKRIYGESDYPFCLQPAGQEVRYEKGECPGTERILDDLLQITVNEKMTDEDVVDIVACFEKVWANLDELRQGE